ncbi:MAG: arylesterase [Desulfobacter sp.]|nr:arylesterase [Desulfobacter sp.]
MKKILILATLGTVLLIFLFSSSSEIRNTNPKGESIVCFGDSLTYGTGASLGMDYPAQLSALTGMEIINAGVPGETTAQALERIDQILELDPKIVIITLGGNDLKNRVSKSTAFNNLETLILTLQESGALVILGGIDIPFYGRGFARGYQDLAQRTGAVLIPNVLDGIMGTPGLMSDPIHPNSQGYTIMARHFHQALRPYLQ